MDANVMVDVGTNGQPDENEAGFADHSLSTRLIDARTLGPWPITVLGSPERGYTAVHDKLRRTRELKASSLQDAIVEIISAGVAARAIEDLFPGVSVARQSEVAGFVYFIAATDGPIKIGFATNPQARLCGLQTGNPRPLVIIATVPGTTTLEREYHTRFALSRLHGEWFERTPELLAEIERLSA